MKKILSNLMLVAAAAMAFSACQKTEMVEPETSQEVMLTFASEKPAFDDETKTEWTGETIQWSAGDKISVAYTVNGNWQNASGDASGDAKLYKSDALEAATETAQFNVSASFKGTTEGTHVFYGVYPAPSSTSFDDAPVATLTVPSIQTPGTASFDGSADLMTGVSVGEFTSLPTEPISMKWTRLVAHANITLKALNGVTAGETVSSITLTAQEGANLVGSQKVDITANTVVNNNNESNVLELNGGNLSIDASGNIEFWACVLPETLTSLAVVVETNKATYTREITGISKTFKQNARNTLTIKMNEATRVAKEEVSWVLVTPADGLTEGTYVLVVSTDTKTGALVSTNGTSAAPTFNTSISVSDNTLNGVTEAMQFDLSGTTGNYKLAVTGQTTDYLYTTGTNNGVRVGTNTNNVWTITQHESNADAFVFKCNATSRYLGVYNNADWRCYTAYDAGNYTNGSGSSQIYLYKKQSGPVVPDTTPSITVEEETLELTSAESEGTIPVTYKNLEALDAAAYSNADCTDDCDWLVAEWENVASEKGAVSYIAAANEGEERTAYIQIYALDAEANEYTKVITVTQKAKVVVDANFEAGDYWIIGVEDGTSHVMLPFASTSSYAYAPSEVITDDRTFAKYAFTFEAVEGGFNIKASDGRYYSTKADYKSFQITDIPSVWTVTVQNDGTYLITDASTGKTIKYGDGTFTTFGVYAESDDNTGVYPILVKADNPLPVELSSIAVSGQTTSFDLDADFEFDGTVTATYNDGSTKIVTPTEVSTPDMSTEGTQTVTITYTEDSITKTASYTITITDPNGGGEIGEERTITLTLNSATTGNTSTSYVQTVNTFTYDDVTYSVNNWNPSSLQIRGNQTTSNNMQSGKNFMLRNTTAIPGKIKSITITYTEGTIVAAKTYAQVGSAEITNQTTSTSVNGTAGTNAVSWTFNDGGSYFAIGMVKGGTSGTTKSGTITIVYQAN